MLHVYYQTPFFIMMHYGNILPYIAAFMCTTDYRNDRMSYAEHRYLKNLIYKTFLPFGFWLVSTSLYYWSKYDLDNLIHMFITNKSTRRPNIGSFNEYKWRKRDCYVRQNISLVLLYLCLHFRIVMRWILMLRRFKMLLY